MVVFDHPADTLQMREHAVFVDRSSNEIIRVESDTPITFMEVAPVFFLVEKSQVIE